MSKLSGGVWVRTIKCGCGECRFHNPADGICPKGTSKEAVWLWASDFSKQEEEVVEESPFASNEDNIELEIAAVEAA